MQIAALNSASLSAIAGKFSASRSMCAVLSMLSTSSAIVDSPLMQPAVTRWKPSKPKPLTPRPL